MTNVSSSYGLEKQPKLRFPGFDEPWKSFKAEELFQNITDKNHPNETVLTIVQGKGTIPRDQVGRNIHYNNDSLANYKKVEKGDYIIHLRSFEGGLEMANESGIVSPAYTVLRCKKPHSNLFYEAYFHTDEFINHVLSKSVEGIRDGRQISYDAFKWLNLPYCDVAEQDKISQLFYTLNKRIEKQQQLVEMIRKYKRGAIKRILSKFSCETNNCTLRKISSFATCVAGATPDTKKLEYWDNGTIPWLSSGEVNKKRIYSTDKKITSLGYKKTSTKMLPIKTVVIALAGQGKTRGTVAITENEVCTNQSLACLLYTSICV